MEFMRFCCHLWNDLIIIRNLINRYFLQQNSRVKRGSVRVPVMCGHDGWQT